MNGLPTQFEDLDTLPGTTFQWDYQIEGLDFTDATAQMVVQTLGSFDVTLSESFVGVNSFGVFHLAVPPETTTAWAPGVYSYRVLVTFADTSVQPLVKGCIVVDTP